jgi:hypothetical protein
MEATAKQAQRDALVAYAKGCTIGIMATSLRDGRQGLQGSGVLYSARGEKFLVTATHVVEGQDGGEIELGLPVGVEGGQHLHRVSIPSDYADVALFKMTLEYAATVEKAGFHFVDGQGDLDRPHDNYDEFMIFGYSAALTTVTATRIEPTTLSIYTKLYDGPTDGVASSAEPKEWDLLFHWPKVQGVPQHAPGISGCGVWGIRYSSDGLWTAGRSLRPVAIETAIVPGNAPRWIRTTRWDAVKVLIDDNEDED